MKKIKILTSVVVFIINVMLLISCKNNSSKNNSTETTTTQEQIKNIEIPGVYSGIDNVGMESTIILNKGGSLIIHASVGDGTPDYGNWTGTADNLSLYHKNDYGNDELLANAKITDNGLRIIGGNFYKRK